jgi:hypothetical protein
VKADVAFELDGQLPAAPRASSKPRIAAASEPALSEAFLGKFEAARSEPSLELGPLRSAHASPSPSPRPLASARPTAPPAPAAPPAPSEYAFAARLLDTLSQRVWPGLSLIAASVLVSIAEQAYASEEGRVFMLGPFRAVWISGVLMLAGVVALIYRFLPRREPR